VCWDDDGDEEKEMKTQEFNVKNEVHPSSSKKQQQKKLMKYERKKFNISRRGFSSIYIQMFD